MDIFYQAFEDFFEQLLINAPSIISAVFVLVGFVFIARITGTGIEKMLRRSDTVTTYHPFFIKLIRWIIIFVGLLISLNILGMRTIANSLLASGGVTAIVLGFAFRDIGENILAGFFLAFSRPFQVGDLIQSEGLEGRVKGVELRHTHIRTADGCDIFIPSSQIFNKPLFNYTRDGLRRTGFTVGIDYADDIGKAMNLLLDVVSGQAGVLKQPAPNITISGFGANYVEVQAWLWLNMAQSDQSLSAVRTRVMEACRKKLLEEKFILSSSVTTALDVNPLSVNVENQ